MTDTPARDRQRSRDQARGLKAWVTQASRDDGVDGVAVNDDPIVGGLCVIQAKRYSRIVGLEAIHVLAGVMDDKKAANGVMVTTSWIGKASREFAARNGRIEIIEGATSSPRSPASRRPRPSIRWRSGHCETGGFHLLAWSGACASFPLDHFSSVTSG